MFGFSHAPELIILVILAAFLLGPKRLPEIGRSLGETVRGIRKETDFLRSEATSIRDEVTSVGTVAHQSVRDSITPAEANKRGETPAQVEPAVLPTGIDKTDQSHT